MSILGMLQNLLVIDSPMISVLRSVLSVVALIFTPATTLSNGRISDENTCHIVAGEPLPTSGVPNGIVHHFWCEIISTIKPGLKKGICN